ncbi:hypothetical protein E2C01_018668 [Portunus trituberculatus]|uniref:Uncharacterized protein n=1 Tax=Portunus trituberculatus TaxID=210409 RepID=A0A5B7DVL9_PORTR|nr:hypothetical protein [Portunus trituberculatus]
MCTIGCDRSNVELCVDVLPDEPARILQEDSESAINVSYDCLSRAPPAAPRPAVSPPTRSAPARPARPGARFALPLLLSRVLYSSSVFAQTVAQAPPPAAHAHAHRPAAAALAASMTRPPHDT